MNHVFVDGDVGELASGIKFQNQIRFYIFGFTFIYLNGFVSFKIYDKTFILAYNCFLVWMAMFSVLSLMGFECFNLDGLLV